jgi:putative hydrolase of the HAD superfamily
MSTGPRAVETPVRKSVIFDLGGVVCRFSPARRLNALAEASRLSTDVVHERLFTSGFDQDCDRGRYDLQQQCDQICSRLHVAWGVDQIARLWAEAFEPDAQVLGAVDAARKTAVTALLTNNGPLVRLVVERVLTGVAQHFDHLCFSYEVGALKPEPAVYLATLRRLATSPARAVFVDDTETNVEGARALGIDAFRFESADALSRELQDRKPVTRERTPDQGLSS